MECNIDQTDRRNRVVVGVIILLAALLGLGKIFFSLIGLVLIVEGVIGWCGIPLVIEKFKDMNIKK